MSHRFPLMVPGATSAAEDLQVRAPFDGAAAGSAAVSGAAAVDRALSTAHALFRDRSAWLPLAERISILEKCARLMEAAAEQLAVEAAREGGKPLVDSRVEVARAVDGVRCCIDALRTGAGQVVPMGATKASAGRLAFTRREPIGVVAAISAFNHPVNLIVHQVFPAVATGCPVVVKPAESTPLSCLRLVNLLREAGLPEAWCQPVVVTEREVAQGLATDPRVAFLSFIGSPAVGWSLRSKLPPGTRCTLEHGGSAPVIVAADADLDDIAPLLVKGGLYHAGQVCVSVKRVFVARALASELTERLAAGASRLVVGDPTDAKTEVGPLIRHKEVDRIEEWVEEARTAGAKVVCGGKRISDSCFEPTVLFDPPEHVRVSRLEIFGPVICVYPVGDLDEAVARANALPFSFQAAVCTRDLDTALRVAGRLDASAVMVNDHTAFRADWMPFAGLRQSGLGVGGIPYTMHDMQTEKMIVVRSREL